MNVRTALGNETITEERIFEQVKVAPTAGFEIDASRITFEADLFSDLDLDSIDAVDLAIKLQEMTGKRFKPQEFKSIRTVGDVVSTIKRLLGV